MDVVHRHTIDHDNLVFGAAEQANAHVSLVVLLTNLQTKSTDSMQTADQVFFMFTVKS